MDGFRYTTAGDLRLATSKVDDIRDVEMLRCKDGDHVPHVAARHPNKLDCFNLIVIYKYT